MRKHLISYDLNKPGQDYDRLIGELERLGAIRVLYSVWVLRSNYTAEQLRDYLRQFIDGTDSLLVVGLTGEAAWTKLLTSSEIFIQSLAA